MNSRFPVPVLFPLVHLIVGVVLLVNVIHLFFLSHLGYSLYYFLSFAPHSFDWWRWFFYPFVQPLFYRPALSVYSFTVILLFVWAGQAALERLGPKRLLCYLFLSTLGGALLHCSFWPEKWFFGLGTAVFCLLTANWWLYPTLVVGDTVKLRLLFLWALVGFGFMTYFVGKLGVDVYSTYGGIPLGWMILHGEMYLFWLFRRSRLALRKFRHRQRRQIQEKLDEILAKISKLGGVEKLSPKEKRFLLYASRFYKRQMRKKTSYKESSPSLPPSNSRCEQQGKD